MNKSITNYEELMAEQQRMKGLLMIQKQQLQKDIAELKQELKPMVNVASFIGKFALPDTRNSSVAKLGASVTIDWLLKKALASSNPLLRILLPTLVKNYSSHYADKLLPFIQRIREKLTSRSQEKELKKMRE